MSQIGRRRRLQYYVNWEYQKEKTIFFVHYSQTTADISAQIEMCFLYAVLMHL